MKSTQNEKILQMKSETLIVGVDIGKENHYVSRLLFVRYPSKSLLCEITGMIPEKL